MKPSVFPLIVAALVLAARETPAQTDTAPHRRDTVIGTNSSEIYHYYDRETNAEVWGVQNRPHAGDPPQLPILVSPEIHIPWPPMSGEPRPPANSFLPEEPR